MKLLFLDESGDHSLTVIDRDYPVFVLGGVIVDSIYYRAVVEPRIWQLKADFFDDPDVILHTSDIIRGVNGFEALNDATTRVSFYQAINALMRELEYTVIACAIKKDAHVQQYGEHAVDPYHYSLEVVVERFCHELGSGPDGGMIFAERRRRDLDDELEMVWKRLTERGTDFMKREAVHGRIVDLSLKRKVLNVAGLQLADLVVSPIGRWVIGRPPREDWAIVESKFRRRNGAYMGAGLVILPLP